MREYHDYDMYGHQPGCARCVGLREEQAARGQTRAKNMLTPKKSAHVTVTYEITPLDGGHTRIITQRFKLNKGQQFNPSPLSAKAYEIGYEIVEAINSQE